MKRKIGFRIGIAAAAALSLTLPIPAQQATSRQAKAGQEASVIAVKEPVDNAEAEAEYDNERWMENALLREAAEDIRCFRLTKAEQKLTQFRKTPAAKDTYLREKGEMLKRRVEKARQALDHVQRIVVIDSLEVDEEDFISAYRLPSSAGKLLTQDEFPEEEWKEDADMAYSNEAGDLIILQQPDSAGYRLTENTKLVGGEWDKPRIILEEFDPEGVPDYPFMTSDGTMLYFASDGDESMGGYDIFAAGRDPSDGEYLEPTNLGMPINSTANDYMLAIDEENGVGWWATDRNAAPGKVTIYIYKLAESRENVEPEDENLIALASLSDYRMTWPKGEDYSELAEKIRHLDTSAKKADDFRLPIAGGKYLTSYDQLPDEASRAVMDRYLEADAELEAKEAQLDGMRREYSRLHNRQLASEIKALETQVEKERRTVRRLRSDVYKSLKE